MKQITLKSVFTIALMMFAGISFLSSSAFAQSSPWVTTTASPYTNPYATASYPASSYTSDYNYYYNTLYSPYENLYNSYIGDGNFNSVYNALFPGYFNMYYSMPTTPMYLPFTYSPYGYGSYYSSYNPYYYY
ncbi:MAG: hypothetical protein P8M22_06350 [Phycisphaerales bacterium]|nr:hypothetical protein [Phycisphaerales bacterium]